MDDVRERFQNLHEFLKAAKFNLNRNNWDYIVGGTETETTLARNRQSLDQIAFKPRERGFGLGSADDVVPIVAVELEPRDFQKFVQVPKTLAYVFHPFPPFAAAAMIVDLAAERGLAHGPSP